MFLCDSDLLRVYDSSVRFWTNSHGDWKVSHTYPVVSGGVDVLFLGCIVWYVTVEFIKVPMCLCVVCFSRYIYRTDQHINDLNQRWRREQRIAKRRFLIWGRRVVCPACFSGFLLIANCCRPAAQPLKYSVEMGEWQKMICRILAVIPERGPSDGCCLGGMIASFWSPFTHCTHFIRITGTILVRSRSKVPWGLEFYCILWRIVCCWESRHQSARYFVVIISPVGFGFGFRFVACRYQDLSRLHPSKYCKG